MEKTKERKNLSEILVKCIDEKEFQRLLFQEPLPPTPQALPHITDEQLIVLRRVVDFFHCRGLYPVANVLESLYLELIKT